MHIKELASPHTYTVHKLALFKIDLEAQPGQLHRRRAEIFDGSENLQESICLGSSMDFNERGQGAGFVRSIRGTETVFHLRADRHAIIVVQWSVSRQIMGLLLAGLSAGARPDGNSADKRNPVGKHSGWGVGGREWAAMAGREYNGWQQSRVGL